MNTPTLTLTTLDTQAIDGVIRIRARLDRRLPKRLTLRDDRGTPVTAAVLLAQGHRARAALDAGAGSTALAERYGWSRSRLSQALALADGLAPDIQERVLLLTTRKDPTLLGERHLRPIARVIEWDEQRRRFERLMASLEP